MLWGVWLARNKKVWEKIVISPTVVLDWSLKQITESRVVWRKNKEENQGRKKGEDRSGIKLVAQRRVSLR